MMKKFDQNLVIRLALSDHLMMIGKMGLLLFVQAQEIVTIVTTKVARSCLSLLSQGDLKQLLWESLTDKYYQYSEQFT